MQKSIQYYDNNFSKFFYQMHNVFCGKVNDYTHRVTLTHIMRRRFEGTFSCDSF